MRRWENGKSFDDIPNQIVIPSGARNLLSLATTKIRNPCAKKRAQFSTRL